MSAIELEHVSRWYGNVVAVNDVSMTVQPGVTGLLGPNGAGKSTLLHVVAGFLPPSAGTVRVGGDRPWRNSDVYRRIGLVPEREAVYGYLTGWEFVLASAKLHRLPNPGASARQAVATVEMEDPQHRRMDTYSKGMQQRMKVAAALVHEPEVLILDEPFNGMDPRQRLHMMELVRRLGAEGRTILFSSHILDEVERVAEQIEVLIAGRLAASGDFRTIRRLMTNRPHIYKVRSSDDRQLGSLLMNDQSVTAVAVTPEGLLQVWASDFVRFTQLLPKVAHKEGIRLCEVLPADESLESVFSYLVAQ